MDKYILIVSAVYPPEPVVSARLSEDITKAIQNAGCKVKVLHPQPTRPCGFDFSGKGEVAENEITVNSYTCAESKLIGRFRESYSLGKVTYRYIKEHGNEISAIYANTWPLFAQYYLAKAARECGIPYYIHVQDVYPESYCHKIPNVIGNILKATLMPTDKFILRNATGIFAISPAMKKYLASSRGIEEQKIMLVRNWQDDQIYIEGHKPISEVSEVCNVMYLGSINPTANVSLIINAVSKLDRVKYHLTIIGNGPDKEHCQDQALKLGLDVTFDTVAPEDVVRAQGQADLLVLCLKKGVAQTATPSKLTAYMLTGRPIVASVDVDSDCANIIRESGCGIVTEPEDEVALRDAIQEIAEMTFERRNSMGENAYEYAMENLSKAKNLNILTDVLLKDRSLTSN